MPSSSSANKRFLFLADPEIIAIPIMDNHEQLVDLKDQLIISFGPSPEIPNNTDYTKMRKTVYEKLVQAQYLLPSGLRFCVYEGHRSLSLQEHLFNNRFAMLQEEHPSWLKDKIFQETTRLVSPSVNLDGTRNVPPHSTGAAIDVYLINSEGEIIDMGIKVEDWMQDVDGSISATDSQKISSVAKNNRSIMSAALSDVGFVNYKGEYWHWSYGDRYWSYYKNQPYAIYGSL